MRNRVFTLIVIAVADVARSAIVLDAVLDASRTESVPPWLALCLLAVTGAISLGLVGIAGRAVFEAVSEMPKTSR